MRIKKAAPQRQGMGQQLDCADRRDQARWKYTASLPDFQRQNKAILRRMVDAFVMSRQFPARLRFSCYVDRNVCLRALSDGRAGG